MPARRPDETAPSFYAGLAEDLYAARVTLDEATRRIQQRAKTTPPSSATIEQLRAEAEAQMVQSPRQAWALAYVAHTASRERKAGRGGRLLEAGCTLTLAVALNALGRFADALELLPGLAERFLVHDQPARAGRCHSETALACTYLGRFEAARTALAGARDLLTDVPDALTQAYCDRAEGLIHLEQNRYPEAETFLRRAGESFATAGRQAEATLTMCHLAIALSYVDPQAALITAAKARRLPAPGDTSIHNAYCDHSLARIFDELNRYTESLALYRQARPVFAKEGMDFLTADCDENQGIALYRLNQYNDALRAHRRARAYFADQRLDTHVARSDLNIAVVYYALGRYTEALTLYQRVAEEALGEGRTLRAARCHTNMGLCYDRLGRYDRALMLHERARQAFEKAAGSDVYVALCQENLAGTYRRLGRHAEALEHCEQARETFAKQGMHVYVARCETHMADLYLSSGQFDAALRYLERARRTCRQEGMAVHVAACDREMARVFTQTNQAEKALARLAEAKAGFAEKGLLVDAALCDLAKGEAYLRQGDAPEAARCFEQALAVLAPSFPDEAWRAQYGLGSCAMDRGNRTQALHHWLSAVELTHRVRANLPTERLSGGFFAGRRGLYEETLRLALDLGETEQALVVAEAGKAQALAVSRLGAGAWSGQSRWRDAARDDARLAELLEQEEALRQQMAQLRRALRLLEADEAQPIFRSAGDVHADQPEALAQLTELARDYEDVVERLRLVAPGWVESDSPALFSVSELRRAAASELTGRWACLDYYLLEDGLITFYLDARQLKVHSRHLSPYDRLALRQCTDPNRDFRELIYQGTIRGHRTPGALGETYLHHLYELLIPPDAEALGDGDLLIIAPHGPLHGLAFQALRNANGLPLAAQVPLTYVPSLSVLHSLLAAPAKTGTLSRILVCGASEFGSRASPLPRAGDELAVIQDALGERSHTLWDSEATREALLHLNETGDLARYDVLHFATHAVLDHLAPSQSRVLLAEGSLAVADILNLELGAAMVVLSACEGAVGRQYPGDEMMGLARAFFLAGARTVVASLWPVEDTSAGEFMGRFYRRLGAGAGVARALRAVQTEMAGEGYDPYNWAPFIAIGLP